MERPNFKRENNPFWGKKHSEESRKRMSENIRKAWQEGKFKPDRNEKISETMKRKGLKPQLYWKENHQSWNKGMKGQYKMWPNGRIFTKEWKEKMSKAKTGKKGILCNAYKNGNAQGNKLIRSSKEYKEWVYKVKSRDDWTCLNCGARCGYGKRVYVMAHHILGFSDYPELRFDVDNGVTLCSECHP